MRKYECFLKEKLVELSKDYPLQINKVLSTFHVSTGCQAPTHLTKDIIHLFTQCKQQDCLPMLVFNTDTVRCKNIFTQLFTQIGCILNKRITSLSL